MNYQIRTMDHKSGQFVWTNTFLEEGEVLLQKTLKNMILKKLSLDYKLTLSNSKKEKKILKL